MSYKDSIKNITIGSDPEMFLYSEKYHKFVPACGLIGGTKEEPKPITDKGHFIQEDNVAVEFCIPPCKNFGEFLENILFVKNYIQTSILDEKELVLRCIGSAKFNYEDLQSEQAQTFGCNPDYNAYTFEQNVIDKDKVDPLLRSCGFHIHIGFDKANPMCFIEIVKAFDLFVGVPSILLDPDTERRELYGKAGCYRLKSYGGELRLLSSFFIQNEELIKWVYDGVMKAISFVNEGGIITNEPDIQDCINTSNKELALEIMDDYKIEIPNYEKFKICVDS